MDRWGDNVQPVVVFVQDVHVKLAACHELLGEVSANPTCSMVRRLAYVILPGGDGLHFDYHLHGIIFFFFDLLLLIRGSLGNNVQSVVVLVEDVLVALAAGHQLLGAVATDPVLEAHHCVLGILVELKGLQKTRLSLKYYK